MRLAYSTLAQTAEIAIGYEHFALASALRGSSQVRASNSRKRVLAAEKPNEVGIYDDADTTSYPAAGECG